MLFKRFLIVVLILVLLEGTVGLLFQKPSVTVSASALADGETPVFNPKYTKTPVPTTTTPDPSQTATTPVVTDTTTPVVTDTRTPVVTDTTTPVVTETTTPVVTDTTTPVVTDTVTPVVTDTRTVTVTPETPTVTVSPTPTDPLPEFYCLPGNVGEDLEYINDFESITPGEAGWSDNFRTMTAPRGQTFLGEYGNEKVQLLIGCLPPEHRYVWVTFDLYIIRSWDGNLTTLAGKVVGPDHWKFNVDNGPDLVNSTFGIGTQVRQSFPGKFPDGDFRAYTGAKAINRLGFEFNGYRQDTIYNMTFIVPHEGEFLTMNFEAWGLQELYDESWGLDNFDIYPAENRNPVYLPMFSIGQGVYVEPANKKINPYP